MEQTTVEFTGDDGDTLRGLLMLPDRPAKCPAVTMAHGFAATYGHGLIPFAHTLVEAGFAVLLHDHRGFGISDGLRGDIDPWRQIADWRQAISFLERHPAVDGDRIGLWGSSFAGGHALVLAATDRRIKAVVSQVPTISGFEQSQRRVAPSDVAQVELAFAADDRARFAGEPPRMQRVVSTELDEPSVYRSSDAQHFYLQSLTGTNRWENSVTLRSSRAARMYEPGQWVSRVSPTPLLMLVALQDTVTLTDTELQAYERALHPKKLVTFTGGHFDAYTERFDVTSSAAREWFSHYLLQSRAVRPSSQG